jgi:zinc protease
VSFRRWIAVSVTLALHLAPSTGAADVTRPVHERRLANGLRVVVSPDPARHDVALVVRYDVGARDEPAGLEGLAHLVEHAMFTGSRHVGPGEHDRLLQRVGANDVNAQTGPDDTRYFQTLPPEQLELGLWLESDRMGYLLDRLDEVAVARARAAVLNEMTTRVDAVAHGLAAPVEAAALFPAWHPYQHLTIGTRQALTRASLADVRAFFATWYGAANACVIIAGKVEPRAALALAERYFGPLPARPPPVRPALPALPSQPAQGIFVEDSTAAARVTARWLGPGRGEPGHAELGVAMAVLAVPTGTHLARLARFGSPGPAELRGGPLCEGVDGWLESRQMLSLFTVKAHGRVGVPVEHVLGGVRAVLGGIPDAIRDEEVVAARRLLFTRHLFALDSSLSWAFALADEVPRGPLPSPFDAGLGRLAAVTPDGVRTALRRWIGGAPRTVVLAEAGRRSEHAPSPKVKALPW